jgi:hypothetical protein
MFDVNSIFVLLHRVNVVDAANVSEVHAASIFRVDARNAG